MSAEDSVATGRWVTSRYEYQREIMDAFNDPHCEAVVVKSSAQCGKTSILLNVVGFFCDLDPSPVLVVQPTLTMAEAFSKDRLAPMIRDSPPLRAKVREARSRDSNNTILHKGFIGNGHLTIIGANSPASVASRPMRVVVLDEVDKYDVKLDILGRVVKRTARFWNRKIGYFCTPTIEGRSRIAQEYEQGDQSRFYVPCPDCGCAQVLIWDQVKWERNEPDTAHYECIECHSWWDDSARWRAVSKGHWRATYPERRVRSFHVWEAYAPGTRLSSMVRTFLNAKDDPAQLENFVNETLGETWKEKGDAPEHERLLERAEPYEFRTAVQGVLFLTAGIDVQADRIEVQVVGWGEGKESWCVDYQIFSGQTSDPESPAWKQLTAFLQTEYKHPSGLRLPIAQWALDSGHEANQCYNWARTQGQGRGIVIKGRDSGVAALGKPNPIDITVHGRPVRHGILLWMVNVSMLKYEFYGWLRQSKPTELNQPYPPGYCHFPKDLEVEFFKQLTAEEVHTRTVKGYTIAEWIKTRSRNEALDTRIYARAAAIRYGLDRFQPQHWQALKEQLRPSDVTPEPVMPVVPMAYTAAPSLQPAPQLQQQQPSKQIASSYYQPVKSGWMNR